MQLTNSFDLWINRSMTRLINIINKILVTDSVESLSGLQGELSRVLSPSCAEEIDFLSINEWMKAQDGGQPTGHNW